MADKQPFFTFYENRSSLQSHQYMDQFREWKSNLKLGFGEFQKQLPVEVSNSIKKLQLERLDRLHYYEKCCRREWSESDWRIKKHFTRPAVFLGLKTCTFIRRLR